MKCGCIVLNYNTALQTIRNVDILLRNNSDITVIVVDNCSPKGDYKTISKYYASNSAVDVIKNKNNGGYSKGNNVGIRYLIQKIPDIEYIAIMNPDVRCDERDVFNNLIGKLSSDPNMGLIAPLMVEGDRINTRKIGWMLPSYRELLLSKMYLLGRVLKSNETTYYPITKNRVLKFDAVQGSFFVIKRSLFEKIGFFDENVFMYSEEDILAARLKQISHRIYAGVDIDSIYIHEHDFDRKPLNFRVKTAKIQFKSQEYYLDKYSELSSLQILFWEMIGWIYLNIEIPIGNMLRIAVGKIRKGF